VNTGILAAPVERLRHWLANLKNDNAQGEYYLTDIIAMAVADGIQVITTQPDAFEETLGVNNKTQLAELERIHQRNIARGLTDAGVTVIDPARLDVRGSSSAAATWRSTSTASSKAASSSATACASAPTA
jgi:bifunctional UDP-N-acetylglucosamine pyrophosphorylase/glucosamine-1-phosphate N-acetyltransferase